MENTIKQNVEETPKKAWISPEMEEIIQINGYFNVNANELSAGTKS